MIMMPSAVAAAATAGTAENEKGQSSSSGSSGCQACVGAATGAPVCETRAALLEAERQIVGELLSRLQWDLCL